MNSLSFTHEHPLLSFLEQGKKKKKAELDHSAACQARDNGSCVTCKTTLSARKFTNRTMDTGSFLITASSPVLLVLS